jgi:hypothetical protein
MRSAARVVALLGGLAALSDAPPAAALVPPRTSLADKVVRHPGLHIPTRLQPASALTGARGARVREALAVLGVKDDFAFYDARAGRLTSFVLRRPLIPSRGSADELRERAWTSLRDYLQEQQDVLHIDVAELGRPRVAVAEKGTIVQVVAPREIGGVAVRGSAVTAVINHGNLVLLGLDHWADRPRAAAAPALDAAEAVRRVVEHVAPFELESTGAAHLSYIPLAAGEGYEYRLAWVVPAAVAADLGSWEALVDAASGALIAFEDRNEYARHVVGGVYPVSNDQRPPDGLEQPGWPMPFTNLGAAFTNAHGLVACSVSGERTTTLAGQRAAITDVCGPISESSAGHLDLGVSGGTDCAVPDGHSAGDTHAARTVYYELNRINEQARAYLPGNTWLQEVLPATTNIDVSCGASWNGTTVSFYRDRGGACRNAGEIAGVVGHEWGHGMDDNGVAASISRPAGGIADIHSFLRLQEPCVGRGFFKNQVCGGYGDPCDPPLATGCTGARHMDFMGYVCDRPHTVTWVTQGFSAAECNGVARPACAVGGAAPCGRGDHCEGVIVAETAFDLARRDLTAPPFLLDASAAHELVTRLFLIGAGPVTNWYTCAVGGGCSASGGYLNLLAVDDDNGDLADGTPHMTAIRAAFERHEIHCATPPAVNSGCAAGPTASPTLTATAGEEQVSLSWTAVPNAARYDVYRTEGVAACDLGKVKAAEATATSFIDAGLLAGRVYSYVVLPVGANPSCFARASNCAGATPTSAPPCPGADFTLGCSPEGFDLHQGGRAISTCTVQSVNGFSAAVGLSCAGLPPGVTCAYDPAVVTPAPNGSSASQLTVAVGAAVPPAEYAFAARGLSGALEHTFDLTLTVAPASAAPGALAVDAEGNGVLQPGETATMAPSWRNTGPTAIVLTGVTSDFTGPGAATYENPDAAASYGTIPAGSTGACADCYAVRVTAAARPAQHWDATIRETVTPTAREATWTLHVGESFSDVPGSSGFFRFVETLLHRGVTGGCGGGRYCPADGTTREQMAPFVLLAREGVGYQPPVCAPPNTFADVPETSPFCRWIEELARRGVVAGCGGGNFCPGAAVTREQMSVFVLRTLDPALDPPLCAPPNIFADVPETSPFCRWIEELARRGVVGGCGGGNYCPAAPVTREQMAVFLGVTFGLTLYP